MQHGKRSVKVVGAVLLGLLIILASLALFGQTPVLAQSTNRLVTVLPSASRTSDATSADQVNIGENLNVRGGYVILDVTGVLTSPVITPSIQMKDPVSGVYRDLLVASTGVTTTGTYVYLVYPGIGSASAQVNQVASFPLPTTWRVVVDHDNTDPITYTVGAMLVN